MRGQFYCSSGSTYARLGVNDDGSWINIDTLTKEYCHNGTLIMDTKTTGVSKTENGRWKSTYCWTFYDCNGGKVTQDTACKVIQH